MCEVCKGACVHVYGACVTVNGHVHVCTVCTDMSRCVAVHSRVYHCVIL